MPESPKIRIVTHSGMFHADDVLAVAILTTIFKNHEIIRTRHPDEWALGDFLVDVGGEYDHTRRLYDHHMPSPPTGEDGHMFSSAGLIWKHYAASYLRVIAMPKSFTFRGKTINLLEQVEKTIANRWIAPIDDNDNGFFGGPSPISDLVSAMGPIEAERTTEKFDSQFREVVKIVAMMFERACFKAADSAIMRHRFSQGKVDLILKERVALSEFEIPSTTKVNRSGISFVIYPAKDYVSDDTYYVIKPIWDQLLRRYKHPFPDHLHGLNREDLEKEKVFGISFIHHSGFIAHADSKDDAVLFLAEFLDG